MEKHVKGLLSALRQAINEAILGSHEVNAALSALGRTGRCPSFAVDVTLEEHSSEETPRSAEVPGELVLSESDEEFLRCLGIQAPEVATLAPLK